MARLICCFIIAVSFLAVYGKTKIGVDMNYQLSNTATKTSSIAVTQTRTTNTLSAVPYIGISPSDLLEISPFIGWILSQTSTKVEDSLSSSNSGSTTTQNSFQLGGRLFFHVIQKDIFDISVGPEVGYRINLEPTSSSNNSSGSSSSSGSNYEKYLSQDIWLGCPFNIDLHLNNFLSARVSSSIVGFSYHLQSIQTTSASATSDVNTITVNLKSIFQPTLGFYVSF
jgi:hypothetical protein